MRDAEEASKAKEVRKSAQAQLIEKLCKAEELRLAEETHLAEQALLAEEERMAEEARLAKHRDKKAMTKERAYEFKQDGKWLLDALLFERCKNDAIDASVKKRFDMETLECLSRAREYESAAKKHWKYCAAIIFSHMRNSKKLKR